MQKLSNLLDTIKARRKQHQRKKKLKKVRKKFKKVFSRDTVTKIIIVVASLAMLIPLILPFLG